MLKRRLSAFGIISILLSAAVLTCSCIGYREPVRVVPGQIVLAEREEAERALAEEWILSNVWESLEEILADPLVRIVAEKDVRSYRETWAEEEQHVDVFCGEYAVRLPLEEIAGYPWAAVAQQLETGQFGPVELKNGWLVGLGGLERADAISQDLSLSVRDTCNQLSTSGESRRDRTVQQLCSDFRKRFVFADDLELFRRLWRSPFEVAEPTELPVDDALATLFLADLKRLIAPPPAEEHVAEVETAWMKGFEFGDETSPEGFSAELFDDRNHVTVLFVPPEEGGEPLDEEFRERMLASVRRHKQWIPGLEMIRKAESVLEMPDLDNSKEIALMLLFSSLQFPDHRTRAAKMLVESVSEVAPEEEDLIEALRAIASGEGRE